jgi:broad specificity phosphatase PhoE
MRLALVRHGEADYASISKMGPTFYGNRRDFAPLSTNGERQALEAADTLRDFRATRVIASPYTRTLHTAAIIAMALRLPLSVEAALHDWLPVRDSSFAVDDEIAKTKIEEFDAYYASGIEPPARTWETLEEIRVRVGRALDPYKAEPAIIVVTHEAVVRSLTNRRDVGLGSVHTDPVVF